MPGEVSAAERIAQNRGISREDIDPWGLRSQTLAAQARDNRLAHVRGEIRRYAWPRALSTVARPPLQGVRYGSS